jgi:hypothetical protein
MSARDVLVAALRTRAGSAAVLAPAVGFGHRRYLRTGTTPAFAYSAMRKVFGSSSCGVLDRLAEQEASESGRRRFGPEGVVADEVEAATDALRRDGLYVFDRRLDEQACAALEALALRTEATLVGGGPTAPARAVFDAASPLAARYDLAEEDLVAEPVVQDLLADDSLLRLAQDYLGGLPVQDLVAMWWTAPVGTGASSAAAQRFHFDLDRLRFVKLFVYLTDVDEGSGPHVYVRGSHRSLPRRFRADRRFEDDEVLAEFGPASVAEVTGPRGSMFVADTKGLHKGLPARDRHRLVFQMEWATSLFGAPLRRLPLEVRSAALARALAEHPDVYRRFTAIH